MQIKHAEDSQCTGGIDSLYILGEKHLNKWMERDIKPVCARCGIQLKLGKLVFTRRRPGRSIAPRCLPCADPLIDWDAMAFQSKEVRIALKQYLKEKKKNAKEMVNVAGQEITVRRGAPIVLRMVDGRPTIETEIPLPQVK